MSLDPLDMKRGAWLAVNCGRFPSEKSCQLVILAPVEQRADLLEAAIAHAVAVHGHHDTPELRAQLGGALERLQL